jgi:23S rRNA (uracil1939-C5)-methyltransferase
MRYIVTVRKGETVRVTCFALDDEGAGVGSVNDGGAGVRVHVAGALPTEEVKAEISHVSPHRPHAWARLVEIEKRAPSRVEPVCPGYGSCGGCVVQHCAYENQLGWKWQRVAEHVGGHVQLQTVAVAPCVASPRPLGYRNRAKLVYARDPADPARRILGAYAPRTHDVINLSGCKVSEAPLDEVQGVLLELLVAGDVEPYDEKTGQGLIRYVILRSNHLGEVLVTLVTASREFPAGEKLARTLMERHREVVGVVQNINVTRGNVLYGAEDVPLHGKAHLQDKVGSVFVRLSPTAFFQVNRDVATLLYGDVLAAAALSGTERVVDCYTGVGGMALNMASRAAEVIGIEENPAAIEDARASAALNHANRTRFVCGDAAAELAKLDAADVLVLNPPRRGCAREVLEATVKLAPRLVLYVSCNPETLVRDLAYLHDRNFLTRSIRPYDMLPQTPHVEALAVVTAK